MIKKYHHKGGSWKLAYVDLLTSLTGLFLVLWLTKPMGNSTDSDKTYNVGPLSTYDEYLSNIGGSFGFTLEPIHLTGHHSVIYASKESIFVKNSHCLQLNSEGLRMIDVVTKDIKDRGSNCKIKITGIDSLNRNTAHKKAEFVAEEISKRLKIRKSIICEVSGEIAALSEREIIIKAIN